MGSVVITVVRQQKLKLSKYNNKFLHKKIITIDFVTHSEHGGSSNFFDRASKRFLTTLRHQRNKNKMQKELLVKCIINKQQKKILYQ